ncbi:Gfo/Idh/MocA family protein [Leucobacter japonicus]|uniref:Gfo/Idh/MocA family protein n=1 Tax=Leucobacter japonicus TaxID=1461259 RepID=UPI000AD689CE|nr:Gfo/Idh/MocA family oxidoreductase [Leucobacter japonicus]
MTAQAEHAPHRALRIGALGASRIADLSIIEAAAETGDELAVVAARDPERARQYAREKGFTAAAETYEQVIADDSLDLIYVGLPNGLHAEWTARALDAGRNVLVEKPFAANLAEFDRVAARLEHSTGWAWEAFHYADHPGVHRLIDLVRSGAIGEVRAIDVHMEMPDPGADDPRWNFDLAGGTLMDLGCYAIHALLLLGDAVGDDAPGGAGLPAGAELTLETAHVQPYAPDARLDATVVAELRLGGVPATIRTSMESDWNFGLRVTGSLGEVVLPNFVKPQEDGRLIVRTTTGAGVEERVEALGSVSSYTYQLQRIRAAVRSGERGAAGIARSRRTMALIDEIYTATGLPLRPGRLTD